MQILLAMASSAISRFWPRLLGSLEGAKQHASLKVFDPLDLLFRVIADVLVVPTPALSSSTSKTVYGTVRCSKSIRSLQLCRTSKSLLGNKCHGGRLRNDALKQRYSKYCFLITIQINYYFLFFIF